MKCAKKIRNFKEMVIQEGVIEVCKDTLFQRNCEQDSVSWNLGPYFSEFWEKVAPCFEKKKQIAISSLPGYFSTGTKVSITAILTHLNGLLNI